MNDEQFIKQISINRDLIVRRNETAYEHMETLVNSYAHLIEGKAEIMLEMNKALLKLYFDTDYAGAIDISLNAVEKFKNSPHKAQVAFHMKMIAHCHLHLGEYDIAMRYLEEAIKTLPTDDKDYIPNKVDMLYALAQAEEHKDVRSEKMAEHLQQALQLLSGEDDIRRANCLMGLGNYYNNIEQPEQALKHFHEAVTTFEKEYLIQHLSNTYSNMGICYLQLQDFAETQNYMQKALDLRLKAGSPDMLAISYSNFGMLYKATEEYDKAEESLMLSQKIAEEIGFKQLIDKNNLLLNEIGRLKNR